MKQYAFVLLAGLCQAATAPQWISEAGGVAAVDNAGRITAVDLRSSWATDADLGELARLPELRKLDLSLSRVSDRGLRALRPAPKIEDLNLYFAEQVTDEGVSSVKGWKYLRRLNVRGTKITDATLEMLPSVPTLESVDVGYAEITDVGLDHLTSLPKLTALTIGGNKLTDAGLHLLRQLPQLQYLDIGGEQRTDSGLWSVSLTEAGMESIGTLKELRELRLEGTGVSTRGLEQLPKIRLEKLVLQNCKRIADDSVPVLALFTHLQVLDVDGTAITPSALAELRRRLPKTKVLAQGR